jgi:UDP-glucuronate 4-epimerase
MRRDFTYIDDVVEGLVRLSKIPAAPDPAWSSADPDPASSSAPYSLYNIGNHTTIEVLHLIEVLEGCLGMKAVKKFVPAQVCEVQSTIADSSDLERVTGYLPSTTLEHGVKKFVEWYREYYGQA